MRRVLRIVAFLLVGFAAALPHGARAQAGKTAAEQDAEDLERTRSGNAGWKIKPESIQKDAKVITFVDSAAKLSEADKKKLAKDLEKPKHHVEVASTGFIERVGVNIDALGMKDGEAALLPENAYVDLKLKLLQAEAKGSAQLNAGPDGVDVVLQLEAKTVLIGVQAQTGKLEVGDKKLGGSVYANVEAEILAEAKALGIAKVGKDGVLVGAEGSLFAGGKAKLEIPAKVMVGGVEAKATVVGEVSYGIGVEGKVYAKITWTSIKFRAQGHAALGVGVGGEVDVEFSVEELVKDMAGPDMPTVAAIQSTKSELTPLADHWTLSKDEYRKMAAAVLAEDVVRGKALAEVKARQDHWIAGLGDYSGTKQSLTGSSDLNAPYVRLQHEIYRNNPDAVAGLAAAIAEAKANGMANDDRWGRGRLKTLQEIADRNARVKMPFDGSNDFLIPQVNRYFKHEGKTYVLPSFTGPEGLTHEQYLGIGDFWVSISEEKKKQINTALAGRLPEDQVTILKKLAGDEISKRIDSENALGGGRPDTSWIAEVAGPAARDAAEKNFTPKQLKILAQRWNGDGGDRLLASEVQEMAYNGAPGNVLANKLMDRLLPYNKDYGQRARNEIRLDQYPNSFPTYLRWLKPDREKQRDHRIGLGSNDSEKIYALSLFVDAMKAKDASVDKVLGANVPRYQGTTATGGAAAKTKAATGAGMLRD